jgi:DNA polymerase-3 subunit alpha
VAEAKLSARDYVHLHNHTQYSLLDGLTRVPDLVELVKNRGMEAVAVTDHGTLSGTIEFYKEAKDNGIKPIIGIETYVAARSHTDKDPQKDKNRYHLILLAMNNTGYQNLMRLSTIANLEGFYYFPRIDHELLERYNEGLIALSACLGGEIGEALQQGQYEQAKTIATWYKKNFGDRYYLEVQDHGHPKNPLHSELQQSVNEQVLKLGRELDIPVVVTCDAHYLKPEDQDAHEILLCVGTGAYLSDEKRMSLKDYPLHVVDPNEVIQRWGKDHPEVITNTKRIAERCEIDIELGKILIPKFPVPKGETEKTFLEKLVYRGLAWRYGGIDEVAAAELSITDAKKKIPKQMLERSAYELDVIESMGFNGYFLIVQDFINWGKDKGIIFGPGRGSAAGSIVSYALKITELDPISYDLMFERFLNPSRISMPDIDIDIQDSRRDEVIRYCIEKYGTDRVANIVTFGRMFARNAVRDVARVMQVPYVEADRLAKLIPAPIQGRHIPLATSLKDEPELRNEYESNPTSRQVLDQALVLEGTVRSHGVHAAGVVIAPDDIVKFTPLEMAQKGVVATQYPMGPVEELGLLKMDFLGLSNLTIINNALRIIRKVHKRDITLGEIPNDDDKTFELFRRADTTGVFQFESAGMKRYLKELKPTQFEDIIAMVALYRPGPMAEIPQFIRGKNDSSSITYLHESLKPILEDTYGVMVFQEQIINLLQLIAGYTAGEADLVRKAIGKKKRDIMAAEEPKFIAGCLKQGLTQKDAEKLWALIQPFADYSFNKAHAACYALIAYWTAYLKANYPSAFMAALMTSDYDDTDRLAIEITECKHMGLEVLPPDVNESFVEFGVVPGSKQIRFGMAAVKNVGTAAVEEILRARQQTGKFESLSQFLEAVDTRIVNRKAMESLIKAGAFDRFGERSMILHNLDMMLAYANRLQKQASSGQVDLFGEAIEGVHIKPKLVLETPPNVHNSHEQLLWERELLGLYLSRHPLEMYETFLDEKSVPLNSLKPEHDGKSVVVGGSITDVREITTKNGQKMAFVKIEDKYGEAEAILFPGSYQQTVGIWERDKVVLIQGKISARDRDGAASEEVKIMVNDAREITPQQAEQYIPTGRKKKIPKAGKPAAVGQPTAVATANPRLYIRMSASNDTDALLSLKQAIDAHQGKTDVVLVLGEDDNKQVIRLPGGIDPESPGVQALTELVGKENVVLR